MITALAPLFDGPLADFRDALTIGPADDAQTLATMLAPDSLAHLARLAYPSHSDGDGRALASEWSKRYFARMLPPLLGAALLLDWQLPLAFSAVRLRVDQHGMPKALVLPHTGEPRQPGATRLAELVDEHLIPVVDAMAVASGLTPRVVWSNAGNYLEWFVKRIEGLMPADAQAEAHAWLTTSTCADGTPNPLFRPVTYANAPPRRRRRVCCLRYLLQDVPLCENCPLPAIPRRPGAA